jgi:Tetratricopeptide repeat
VLRSLASSCTLGEFCASAEKLYLEAGEIQRRALGPDRRQTLDSLSGLARVYSLQGKLAQAEALEVQTLAGLCAAAPPSGPRETLLDNMVGLAFTRTWVTPLTA